MPLPNWLEHVGLDIGRTAIKAVRYRRSPWREDLTHCSVALPADIRDGTMEAAARRAAVLTALRTFVADHRLQGASVTTALPCHELFVRSVTLPFQDVKKQAQVVPFEIENLIPLGLEDVAVDFLVLPPPRADAATAPTGTSDLLVAAVPRQVLADHLQLCADAGLKTPRVTVDALALSSALRLLDRSGYSVPGESILIDLGASKTTLCLTFRGRPWVLRSILWGFDHLASAVAARQGCPPSDAEALMRTMTAQQLEPCLAPLIKEIQLTLHAYEANTQTRIWQGMVCGGGAHLREIATIFSKQLELETVPAGQGLETLADPEFAVALGLAVGTPRPLRLPFRKDSSGPSFVFDLKNAPVGSAASRMPAKRDLLLIGLGLAILCLLGAADLWVRVTLKEQRLQLLRATLQARYGEQFPGAASPGEELEQARSAIAAAQKRLEQLEKDRSTVLPALAELVRALPKGVPLKIGSILIEHATLQLEADTDSFDSVERIKQALAASKRFSGVAMNDVRVGTSANQVRFRAGLEIAP
jgi:general secretion pathway protein L